MSFSFIVDGSLGPIFNRDKEDLIRCGPREDISFSGKLRQVGGCYIVWSSSYLDSLITVGNSVKSTRMSYVPFHYADKYVGLSRMGRKSELFYHINASFICITKQFVKLNCKITLWICFSFSNEQYKCSFFSRVGCLSKLAG